MKGIVYLQIAVNASDCKRLQTFDQVISYLYGAGAGDFAALN